ncbi:MAG: heme-binding domain-containing protein, partial [Gemmatimonadota bacterium]
MPHTTASRLLAAAALLACAVPGTAQVLPKSGPVPHNTAREEGLLQQVKAPAGFTTKFFAGPPVAMYPTCLTATVQGALFVCVDPNLSLSADKGKGRVVRLVDDNGDGIADRYSIFAEMDSPRGVAYDGKTLFVMHPPTLTAYRDTNGDGIADVTDDLVKGLGFGLDFRGADHGTNGITLGIDGWIYIAVGDYGYVKAVGKDGTTISHHGGSVVRVRTDGTGLEIYAVGTRNIYDLGVDPFLHVFTRDNTNDGDGWDTRLHYIPAGANMGYPMLYLNFATEHMPSLADYGAGAGTGGLWVHDPGMPEGFGNTLYTGDWTVNKVLRHPMAPKGASFSITQETFLDIPHPTDMAMDGQSNMFVASLSGGTFNYIGDSVGYIVRVSPPGAAAKPVDPAKMNDAALRAALLGPNASIRLQAQQELLRRPSKSGAVGALQSAMLDKKRPAYARVAAMFTLRQILGPKAQPALLKAAADPAIRDLAIRALVDDKANAAKVPTPFLVTALSDTSPSVQLQAIAALVRQNAVAAAPSIVPLLGSADPAVAHIAVNALVTLDASDAALKGLSSATPAVRVGALRVLQQLHEPQVVTGLLASGRERDVLFALARLYHREADWKGDWWGTRPFFAGPYFAGITWEESARIGTALQSSVLGANPAELGPLLDGFVKNRVIPQGAG